MDEKSLPSPELLRKLLTYDADTGKLYWRERPVDMFPHQRAANSWNARFAGKEALTADSDKGYRKGKIYGTTQLAHRVIWAMEMDVHPSDQIDHENGNRSDNRLANLRDVTNAENGRNQKRHNTSTSGVTGVYWNKARRKWRAHIKISGRQHHLGLFNNFADAVAARHSAETEHGFHENHGRAA